MIKRMTAKFAGKCAISGAQICVGDDIMYDTVSRKAYFVEHDDPTEYSFAEYEEYEDSDGRIYCRPRHHLS